MWRTGLVTFCTLPNYWDMLSYAKSQLRCTISGQREQKDHSNAIGYEKQIDHLDNNGGLVEQKKSEIIDTKNDSIVY
jgi:hypothetical protein